MDAITINGHWLLGLNFHKCTKIHSKTLSCRLPSLALRRRQAGGTRQRPLRVPQAVLPWLCAERRGQRVVTAWGVRGPWAVMGPGLLGEPPQTQGVTGGDAGW